MVEILKTLDALNLFLKIINIFYSGVLTLPWSQPPTSACVEDSLGNNSPQSKSCMISAGITCTVYTFSRTVQSTHLRTFSKSKFNLKSDRVNLVAPASPIECLLYLPNVRAIQYKLGPERLTRLRIVGNSNVLRLPVSRATQCRVDPACLMQRSPAR